MHVVTRIATSIIIILFIIATEEYLNNMYCYNNKLEFAAKKDPGQCGAQAVWIESNSLEQKYKCKAFNQEDIRKRRELSNCPKTV